MWLVRQKLLTVYCVFDQHFCCHFCLSFSQKIFLNLKTEPLAVLWGKRERGGFTWICPTMIYAQHGVECEEGKRLKKLNNFIEPPVWCRYSRTLLFPLEWIPRGADAILVRCQCKNTITWDKAQAFWGGGSVSLDCSPFSCLTLIQRTNSYLLF